MRKKNFCDVVKELEFYDDIVKGLEEVDPIIEKVNRKEMDHKKAYHLLLNIIYKVKAEYLD